MDKAKEYTSFDEIRVGLVLAGVTRSFAFVGALRVEAVGHDWAVARSNSGTPWLIEQDELPMKEYREEDYE